MFNLEQAMKNWRQQLLSAGINTRSQLEELESHLREDVQQQLRSGASEEQAFEAAAQRIGQAKTLKVEFAKVTAVKETRERKLKLLCITLAGTAYLTPLALSAPKPWSRMNSSEQWLGLAAVVLTMLWLFSGLCIHRLMPVIPDKRIRTRIQVAAFIPALAWLCLFALVIMPHLKLTVSQTTVATLWAISPLALFGGLTFGLDEAARRTTSAIT